MPIPAMSVRAVRTEHALLWRAAALALYLTMVLGPLQQLAEIAGAPVFAMRPTGYDLAKATRILAALGAEGRRLYRLV